MHILIAGAGVIGVTTAYELYKKGHEVSIIDRNFEVASEASFANGGQLSFSHAEPWANMNLLKSLPSLLLQKNSPILFSKFFDKDLYKWCLGFINQCRAAKSKQNNIKMLEMALYSRQVLQELDEELNIEYARNDDGIIHFYNNNRKFDQALKNAEFQKQYGCDYKPLASRKEIEDIEPAFTNSASKIVGGLYFPIDGAGHVNKFVTSLAKYLQSTGKVNFILNSNIKQFNTSKNKISSIATNEGELKADKYIVCLGADSPLITKKLGIKLPIYPMKGYSISVDIKNPDNAPLKGVTDQCNKIVYSRLGNILRVAGTAEFAGYNKNIRKQRIELLKKIAKNLFPDAGDYENTSDWACLRPQTPSGMPIIAKSDKFDNLLFNTGHGTLGWTNSFASAKMVSELI